MPYRVERIEPSKTALIVVDMQHDFLEFPSLAARAAQIILPNLRRAIAFCRQNGIRIVYTTHVHRYDGTDLGSSPSRRRRLRVAPSWPTVHLAPRSTPRSLLCRAISSSRSTASAPFTARIWRSSFAD